MPFPTPKDRPGEKAKRPMPGLPLDHKVIGDLLVKYRGNVSKVADAMGTARHCIRNVIDRDTDLQQGLKSTRELWIDDIEQSVLSRADEGNDTALQCFVLKTQGRHRGWEQSEAQNTAKDIATAAFDFILNKSKNPAETESK